ncbi:MAG TPA: hypothetical protein VNO55_26035, partial [Polyangia bacterium]|nr:hypothetical protein [Polyangia bacterium]
DPAAAALVDPEADQSRARRRGPIGRRMALPATVVSILVALAALMWLSHRQDSGPPATAPTTVKGD